MSIFTKISVPIIVLFLGFTSCKNTISNEVDYLKWINHDDHGLVSKKNVGDVELQAMFLPADLLAWKELKGKKYAKLQWDSLVDNYAKSLSFSLSIGIKGQGDAVEDIMYRGIRSELDFKRRVNEVNFGIEKMLKLVVNDDEYFPVLAVMESSYGTQGIRKFYIVFSADDRQKIANNWLEFDLVFTDDIFETGISHFRFKKNAIEEIPQFEYIHQ